MLLLISTVRLQNTVYTVYIGLKNMNCFNFEVNIFLINSWGLMEVLFNNGLEFDAFKIS